MKKEIKILKEKLKPQNTVLKKQFNLIREIYSLTNEEYEIMICEVPQAINDIFWKHFDCLKCNSSITFAREYLNLRYEEKERVVHSLCLKNIANSSHRELNYDLLKIFDNPHCNTSSKIADVLVGKPEKSTLKPEDFSYMEKERNTAVNILINAVNLLH